MEDSDILPYLHQDRIPPVDNSTRLQRLERTLASHRTYRAGRTVLGPVNKRFHAQYKAHPRRVSAVIAIIVLALAGSGVYAVVTTHTFPAQPVAAGTAAISSTCTNLVYGTFSPGIATTSQVVAVNCGGSTAAFTVTTPGSDSASFALPTPGVTVTSLGIVPSTGSCSIAGTGETPLTPGTPGPAVSLTAGSYNYCVHYTVPSTANSIASFSLSWAT
jgi:hypothetical protein